LTAPGALAGELCRIGLDAGLERVGVCGAEPFAQARSEIESRREAGLAAGMAFVYRRPERSTEPARTLPGARALVVGALGYRRRDEPGVGARVARYSWTDYYRPLRRALGAVAGRLEAEGWRARVLADDNALVDRAAAVRAGIGWYGKNTNVLIPGRGSWFVLGSVVTDAPIAPDAPPEPVADGCGGCRRCLADCPTGALVAPGVLDARRCLAWLLQAPGPFPVEFREALGDRVYGCDDCQERCPVNRRGDPAGSAPPADPGAQPRLPVEWLLEASDAELEAEVGRWYIPGRDLDVVRRNALVVLGNTGSAGGEATGQLLSRYLSSASPMLREHAAWAALRLGRGDLLAGGDVAEGRAGGDVAEGRAGGGEAAGGVEGAGGAERAGGVGGAGG
jgi:epoxyqueuosine reductase